jgi:chaperonin GroES
MAEINLVPMGDRIIVEPVEEKETTLSGIILPESAKEKPQRGTVLAVGPGPRDEDGKHITMDVSVGDVVLYSKYAGSGSDFKLDDKRKVLILKESDLLAKVID